jgi:hypothetical protein
MLFWALLFSQPDQGFGVHQGNYIKDFKTDLPREIDVLAELTSTIGGSFLRVSFVTECKWTADKPWIIFTDPNSRIAAPACIAQTIGTKTAEALMWCLAADPEIQALSIFHTPGRPGFNGRQAFGSQNDLVYSTLQSVMSACFSEKKYYEKYEGNVLETLKLGVLIIPIIVIDGKLFEAYYKEDEEDNIIVEERTNIRLHWRGSEAWNLHSTVDVVTIDFLKDYVSVLQKETNFLLEKMQEVFLVIRSCAEKNSLDLLQKYFNVSRGVLGLPELLNHIANPKFTF